MNNDLFRNVKFTSAHSNQATTFMFISTSILVWLGIKAVVFFCTCRRNQTMVHKWKIVVNFIVCKLCYASVFMSVCARVWQRASCCVGLHPLVCSLIAESHLLHKLICLIWTATMNTANIRQEEEKIILKGNVHHMFISVSEVRFYLPYVYGMGCVFSPSIWWRRGVKILQASRNSSLWQEEEQLRSKSTTLKRNGKTVNYNSK